MSPQEFKGWMNSLEKKMKLAANFMGARVAFVTGRHIVSQTPIDTGQAKSNWQASINRPRTRTRKAYAAGTYGSTTDANVSAAVNQIGEVCMRRSNNRPIYLTNNLHYIGLLDSSYDTYKSKQNPVSGQYNQAFVHRGIQAGLETARNLRIIKKALSSAGVRMSRVDAISIGG